MSPIAAPSFFLAFTPKISPWSSRRARDSTEPPDFGCSADLLVLRVAKEITAIFGTAYEKNCTV
jgi:hypothetical protein